MQAQAKEGHGCDGLRAAINATIRWDGLERRSSPRIFKLIKDAILALRDAGTALCTVKELRALLEKALPPQDSFDDPTLNTVIGLLEGPGVLQQLGYGGFILLQPEWINAYAQAVIRTLRADLQELGCLPLGSIAAGKLLFQTVARRNQDGSEVFDIKNPRWVDYWQKQPHPVMLVVGTFDEDEERWGGHGSRGGRGGRVGRVGNTKLEFEAVRWMEISAVLKQASAAGESVKHIRFEAEAMDRESILRWRQRMCDAV